MDVCLDDVQRLLAGEATAAPTVDGLPHLLSLVEAVWKARESAIEDIHEQRRWVRANIPHPPHHAIYVIFDNRPDRPRLLATPKKPGDPTPDPLSLPGPNRVEWYAHPRNSDTGDRFPRRLAPAGQLRRVHVARALTRPFLETHDGKLAYERLREVDRLLMVQATRLRDLSDLLIETSEKLTTQLDEIELTRSIAMFPSDQIRRRGLTEKAARASLQMVDGNVTLAARITGFSQSTFRRRLRRFGVDPAEYRTT